MSYQVLARKWRPGRFNEMVGQEHVRQALVNGLDNDRLHHAFLFTGTRGVGKTTIARIFAKSLNCLKGVSSEPCGQCESCVAIDEGRFVDLIEVDAASRTGVDDMRELLENVQYAPASGRYKVYLIDEVHMLSTHSFNALLKTLEEPPPHVKFLLATTDPQKLPVTVLSRCLQFHLKRLDLQQIQGQLRYVLQAEGIEHEAAALRLIARAADGSLRDALSLLDQAIAYGGGRVEEDQVAAMLGTVKQAWICELVDGLMAGDAAALLAVVEQMAAHAPDYAAALDALNLTLHRIAVAQLAGVVDESLPEAEQIHHWAQHLSPERVQLLYQLGLHARRDLPHAPDGRSGFEMALLRMQLFQLDDESAGGAAPATAPAQQSGGDRPQGPAGAAVPSASASVVEEKPQPISGLSPPEDQSQWENLVKVLPLTGSARQLARYARLQRRDGDRWYLELPASYDYLLTEAAQNRLQQTLEQALARPVRVQVKCVETVQPEPADASPASGVRPTDPVAQAKAHPVVQAVQEQLGGQILPETVTRTGQPGPDEANDGENP